VIVPHAEPVQPPPETLQVTAVLVVPVTVAANCCVFPVCTEADVGLMLTATGTGGGLIETVALADFVGSATDVAVTAMEFGLGGDAGAV